MSDDTPLSPLRDVLCSHANAIRVARQLCRDGSNAAILATGNALQPWLIIDTAMTAEDVLACA